ncbi:MAG: DUF1553 domain-containing protein [Planctomycetota bacterium]
MLFAFLFSQVALAQPTLEYNRDIRPILTENCFACHGADSGSRQADLRLDQRDAAIEFGAIEPGDVEASELIARIFTDDHDILMPPPETKKTLSAEQKKLLKRWIAEGAEYQPHWSFVPIIDPKQPRGSNESQVRNPIDRFVFARLEQEGLTPAPEAEPRALFRRLHYDILGLPPKPADVVAFEADYEHKKDLALSSWIDRLMESSAWGEHRARYWLDAARYADTHGLHFDNYREMWPYRDWVIRAFNENQAFDQFTVEQLAGDLLPNPRTDQLIATGFQRCNVTTNEGGTIDAENLALYAADRVQTFGWVFLGLTTNCAQCHDHKFDPFSMRDYYSLAAFFGNTESPPKDGNSKSGNGPTLVVPAKQDELRWKQLPGEIALATAKRESRADLSKQDSEAWLATATPGAIAEIPSEGLAVHLPMNEGEGRNIQSLAGSVSSYKASGPIKWRANGIIGPSPIIRNGSTFELGDVGNFRRDQPFSYGAWTMTSKQELNKGINAAIIARMDEADGFRGWDLWQSDTILAVHIIDTWTGNALKVSTDKDAIQPSRWHHVFATYDGSGKPSAVKIYVDGKSLPLKVNQNSLRKDASISTSTPLRIGQRSKGAVFRGGSIQDVRIYDRLLSDDDVQRLAKLTPVRHILTKAKKDWTKGERLILRDYYLSEHDPEYPALAKVVAELEAEKGAIAQRSPVTHIQREKKNSAAMAHILMRGAYDQPGEQVPAATPAALHPMPNGAPHNRLGLARWVVDDQNPLTARVTVNRFWQEVFGQGLVPTTEDFGVSGALPSHPELLDWLATDFVRSGWDVKHFFKQMFMSATYRQAPIATADKLETDPSNALLSRGPRFRMDAEMIRDTALAVSGLLSPRMFGPGTRPYQPDNIWDIVGLPGGDTRSYKQDRGENLYRRTIYNFWKRMSPSPNMEAFNAPSREVCTVRRERTNTPLQSLVTLNDPQFVETARQLATVALTTSGGDDGMALDLIAEKLLARRLSSDERKIAIASHRDYLRHYQQNGEDAEALTRIGDAKVDEELDTVALAAWTMVCNQMMNLDEVLNK